MTRSLKTIYEDIRAGVLDTDQAIALLQGRGAMPESRGAAAGDPDIAAAPSPEPAVGGRHRRLVQVLTGMVARATGQAPGRIDPEGPFDALGVDSLIAKELTAALEAQLGDLPATLFFEHDTVAALAEALLHRMPDRIAALIGPDPAPQPSTSETVSMAEPTPRSEPASGPAPVASTATTGPVAIIALDGRFPGAAGIEAFHDNLLAGRDAVTEIPAARWPAGQYYDPRPGTPGRSHCRWGGFIDDVDRFDPFLFNVNPKDAALLDPQIRLALEAVWTVFERAGLTQQQIAGRHGRSVGVFVGSMYQQYRGVSDDPGIEAALSIGSFSSIANRISYRFGLEGPSIALDTMCSSTAVAIHTACRSLRAGECSLAVVVGVNLSIHPHKYVGLSQAQMIAGSADSRAFAQGDGYIPAEAVGAILLKPLAAAEADGDRVLAVVRGSAVVHAGRTTGFGAPDPAAQIRLIQATLADAGIAPDGIDYVEAAANGFAAGDAVEALALARVFAGGAPLPVGSVKALIGHAEAASGLTQIARAVLQLDRNEILPGRAPVQANAGIDFSAGPLRLAVEREDWPLRAPQGTERPKRILIDSFGAGGTYASLVLEGYRPSRPPAAVPQAGGPVVLPVSALTGAALGRVLERLADWLEARPGAPLAGVAHTLQVGRDPLPVRWAVVAADATDAACRIRARLAGGPGTDGFDGDPATTEALAPFGRGRSGRAIAAALAADGDPEGLACFWARGGEVDWAALWQGPPPPVEMLPTYPFERMHVRLDRPSSPPVEGVTAGHRVVPVDAGGDRAGDARALLAAALGVDPAALPVSLDLGAAGLNSIGVLKLRHDLEQGLGIRVPLASLAPDRRLGAVLDELEAASADGRAPAGDALPVLEPDPAHAHDPFPLTEIQEAYLAGRRLRMDGDGTGALIMLEIDVTGLDPARLNAAWGRLLARHGMLRSIVTGPAEQRIPADLPAFAIGRVAVPRPADGDVEAWRAACRRAYATRDFDPGRQPRFALDLLDTGTSRHLYLAIDELLLDAASLRLLLDEWWAFYQAAEAGDPAEDPAPLPVSFRDYVLAMKRFETGARFAADLAYWLDRLEDAPAGPALFDQAPQTGDDAANAARERLVARLPAPVWARLQARARQAGVSETALVLTIFSRALRQGGGGDRFSLVLTLMNRPPLHPEIDRMVGPFISTMIFAPAPGTVAGGEGAAEAAARETQTLLWADLDHATVPAVRLLRELRTRRRPARMPSLPVVFTSMLGTGDVSAGGLAARIRHSVNTTPQIFLDHQLWQSEGALLFSWDVATARLPAGRARALLDLYLALLYEASEVEDGAEPAGFPLTDQQAAYAAGRILGGQAGRGSTVYQEIVIDRADPDRLRAAWTVLVARHPMLRARISRTGRQHIAPLAEAPRLVVHADADAGAEARRAGLMHHVFPLDGDGFCRAELSQARDGSCRLHLAIDLMIADGRSIHMLVRELLTLCSDPAAVLPPVEGRFRDYVMALAAPEAAGRRAGDARYWTARLEDLPGGPVLPAGPGAAGSRHVPHARSFAAWDAFRSRALARGLAPAACLLAAYLRVLAAHAADPAFAVVVPRWDRSGPAAAFGGVVGDFTAMSWVANPGPVGFAAAAAQCEAVLAADRAHAHVNGLSVLRRLGARRGGAPAFPVVFTDLVDDRRQPAAVTEGIRLGPGASATPDVDLDNISEPVADGLSIVWSAREGRFPAGEVDAMLDSYLALLDRLAAGDDAWEDDGREGFIRQEEGREEEGRAESDTPPTLTAWFEATAARNPAAVAVIDAAGSLSYAELDAAAGRLARSLTAAGFRRGEPGGILMTRSAEMVVALLAVLKAGGAWVPLDPDWPGARLRRILDEAGIRTILAGAAGTDAAAGLGVRVVTVARDGGGSIGRDQGGDGCLPAPTGPDDLAYVIYTSGSSGTPKGCMIPHRAIVNRIRWMQRQFRLTAADHVLQKTPYTFDVSVWEFFWPLVTGAVLVMCPPGAHAHPGALIDIIRDRRVTICHFVPSMLRVFLDHPQAGNCTTLRDVFASGEALPRALVDRFAARLPGRLHNLYGPTEAAVDVTWWPCGPRDDDLVPIGRPIDGVGIHLLSPDLQPVAAGETGEICISGVGVGDGYLNRPGLTAERFVAHDLGGGRPLYRTGDSGRLLPDGELLYLGRLDQQVKLRGLRIEPGEVEAALCSHPGVLDAAVCVREADGPDPKLVAYVVPAAGAAADPAAWRRHAGDLLPRHMVPNLFVAVAAVPTTAHGKRDLKALPWPPPDTAGQGVSVSGAAETADRDTEVLAHMIRSFADRLGLPDLGAGDDLLAAGATSLTLIDVVDDAARRFGATIAHDALLDDPTPATLARALRFAGAPPASPVPRIGPDPSGTARAMPVAVTGLNGLYPGAASPEAFWRNLIEGVDGIGPIPEDRWPLDGFFCADPDQAAESGRSYSRWGGFLPPDAGADGAPARADRLLLTVLTPLLDGVSEARRHRTGLFLGCMAGGELSTGLLAARAAHALDLRGPGLAVDGLSAAALAAVHQAARALAAGDCDVALAAAVNLLDPARYVAYCRHRALETDPARRGFGGGSGFIPAECVAAVRLERLSDRDPGRGPALAVIRGSAMGHAGGARRFMAPDPGSQAAVMRACLDRAGLDPAAVDVVETPASGMPLADEAGLDALRMLFHDRPAGRPCPVGSAEPSIGHAEGASGMALLTKAVFQLQTGRLPPLFGSGTRASAGHGDGAPVVLQTTAGTWPPPAGRAGPRTILVNSVGSGGLCVSLLLSGSEDEEMSR